MSKSVVTRVQGVVSYPNLFKAKRNNLNGKDEYSADILFEKNADISTLKSAIDSAIEKKFGADKSKHPKNLRNPIKNGDDKGTPEYDGKYYITCKADASKGRLIVCDNEKNPLLHEVDIQGGDTINASLTVYAYDANGNRGVSCGLNGVQLVKKAETPFSGRPRSADDMFDSFADDSYEQQNTEMFN